MKHIVVVGAGFGGLATAARLAHRGHRVTVVEKNEYVGGRSRSIRVGQCRFDSGPTLLMMLDPFRKLFADLGEDFDTLVKPQLCDPSYRVFFRDGSRIDATTRVETMVKRLEALTRNGDAARYPGFLAEIKALYEEAIPHFVRKNYRSLADFASPDQLNRVVKHGMLSNLWKRVANRFDDERVRMLFSFQTMYLGLSPFDAPFVYSTLAYMEFGEGIFYPEGGLGKMSTTVASLAEARGAKIRLGAECEHVDATGVVLKGGERIGADAVVVNADLPYAQRELQAFKRRRNLRNSCSAHLLYLDYEGDIAGLEHHNVFFGGQFKDNLDSLFHDLCIPRDPAFYVCVSSKTDPTAAPAGRSNVFVLVPVPNLDYRATPTELRDLERFVLNRLECEVGFDASAIRTIERRGAAEWQSELNLEQGAAFGIRADLFQSAFMRPQNKSAGVYYAGASTVPGNGLPMVLISAELVEQRLVADGVI